MNAFTTKARVFKTRAFTVSIATIYLVAAAADGDDVAGSVQRVFVRIRRIRGIVDTPTVTAPTPDGGMPHRLLNS